MLLLAKKNNNTNRSDMVGDTPIDPDAPFLEVDNLHVEFRIEDELKDMEEGPARDKAIEREDAGARDPAPAHFWETFFEREFTGRTRASVLDVACGHGAVTGIAVAAGRSAGIELEARCADYSQAAVDELCKRFPGVEGVACDAADMPWPDRHFDFVVSQFGIEYAGDAAFGEAARLVAEGGTLAALTHLQGGAIHAECADNFAVAQALREAQGSALGEAQFHDSIATLP